ncbi:disks large homolog 5-like [Peromyscus maniculatus bairdii]|uniref:disks large homolog 5-like n=1 Tax=Peromyscus maniculatus bairdii TaxID=230844 RepID=UPI003FD62124
MASTGRSEGGRSKMAFSLHVTHQETNGSGENAGLLGRHHSTPFFLTEQEQQLNQVEKLKLHLQMMTNDRNELREFLAHYSNELNNRLNSENEMQNTEHKKDMSDVKKLPKEISEALYKCTELSEKTKIYR